MIQPGSLSEIIKIPFGSQIQSGSESKGEIKGQRSHGLMISLFYQWKDPTGYSTDHSHQT